MNRRSPAATTITDRPILSNKESAGTVATSIYITGWTTSGLGWMAEAALSKLQRRSGRGLGCSSVESL